MFGGFHQGVSWKDWLEIASEDVNVLLDLVLVHELEHVASGVGGRVPFTLHELYVHQGVSSSDSDWLSLIAEIDKLQGESPYETTVDFGSVQE